MASEKSSKEKVAAEPKATRDDERRADIALGKANVEPGATLATYREIESRIARSEPGWSIRLEPPLLALPELSGDRDRAFATAAWASSRSGTPLVLNGPESETSTIAESLRDRGAIVRTVESSRLSLRWDTPE